MVHWDKTQFPNDFWVGRNGSENPDAQPEESLSELRKIYWGRKNVVWLINLLSELHFFSGCIFCPGYVSQRDVL